jgi:hypothetical protein
MAQSETNGHMLNANISKGHDDQSSPSHPPLGRGEAMWVRGIALGHCLTHTNAHKMWTQHAQYKREAVARDGHANESRASTAIHAMSVWQYGGHPASHGITTPLYRTLQHTNLVHHCDVDSVSQNRIFT